MKNNKLMILMLLLCSVLVISSCSGEVPQTEINASESRESVKTSDDVDYDKVLNEYLKKNEDVEMLVTSSNKSLYGDHDTAVSIFQSGGETILHNGKELPFGLSEDQLYSPSEILPGGDNESVEFTLFGMNNGSYPDVFNLGSSTETYDKYEFQKKYNLKGYRFEKTLRQQNLISAYLVLFGNDDFVGYEFNKEKISNDLPIRELPLLDLKSYFEGEHSYWQEHFDMISSDGRKYVLSIEGLSNRLFYFYISYKIDNTAFIFLSPFIYEETENYQEVYDAIRAKFGKGEYIDTIFDRVDSLVNYTPSSDGNVKE